MKQKPILSISGLRGIVGESLFPETVFGYAYAFGVLCGPGKVILARDPRSSGKILRRFVMSGLSSAGCDIVDLGICPTPTLTLATEKLGANGGICITASHNPIQWNGMKFVTKRGTFLDTKEMKKLNAFAQKGSISLKEATACGKVHLREDWYEKHIEQILKLGCIRKDRIGKANLAVVVDSNNGATSKIAPLLAERLGCRVIRHNCAFSRDFAHPPEPTRENLSSLASLVRKKRADIGFCLDPDGDRLGLVADGGIPLSEEFTLALAARFILSRNPGGMVINLSTSKATQEVAEDLGSHVFRTPVGEYNVAKKLQQIKGVLGGEGNGGVILPELHYTRDGLVGMALILEYLAESGQNLSQLIRSMPRYFMLKKKIKKEDGFENKLANLISQFRGGKINRMDGIRIEFEDSWLHIRASNTEPIVRIIAEAKTKRLAEKLVREAMKLLT